MMKHAFAATAAAAFLLSTAVADVTARWTTDGGEIILVKHRDEDNFSMMSGGGGLIVKDGRAYAVSGEGSSAMVIDVDAKAEAMASSGMGAMMSRMMGGADVAEEKNAMEAPKLRATGKTETHAGVTGEVYETTDDAGRRIEVVLSDDRAAEEATQAFMLAGAKMADTLGKSGLMKSPDVMAAEMRTAVKELGGGLLRTEGLTLVALDDAALPGDAFALPAPPQEMNLGAMMGGRNR